MVGLFIHDANAVYGGARGGGKEQQRREHLRNLALMAGVTLHDGPVEKVPGGISWCLPSDKDLPPGDMWSNTGDFMRAITPETPMTAREVLARNESATHAPAARPFIPSTIVQRSWLVKFLGFEITFKRIAHV